MEPTEEEWAQRQTIINNLIMGAKQAGVQHLVVVDDVKADDSLQMVHDSGIPYTCIRPTGEITKRKDYSYCLGVQQSAEIESGLAEVEAFTPVYHEDLAAVAVESLLSLDWTKSRCLQVTGTGAPTGSDMAGSPNKRPDQEWCVNSFLVEQALSAGTGQFSL